MKEQFDRIQNDIENAKGELMDSINTFNQLAGELIICNEWNTATETKAFDIRQKLQEAQVMLKDFES